ncbi:hypothetical protein GQ457_01G018090 [Hibiscus cannabinus]
MESEQVSHDGDATADVAVQGATYASKVRMPGKDNRAGKQPNVFVEQKVVILFDDIIVSTTGPILSIQFSDRVHDQLCKMAGDVKSDATVEVPIEDLKEKPSVSETNLYGPWMLVESRRRRVTSAVRQGKVLNCTNAKIQGSRYGVLDQVIPKTQVDEDVRFVYSKPVEQIATKILPPTFSVATRNGQVIAGSSDIRKGFARNATYLKWRPEKKKMNANSGDVRNDGVALLQKRAIDGIGLDGTSGRTTSKLFQSSDDEKPWKDEYLQYMSDGFAEPVEGVGNTLILHKLSDLITEEEIQNVVFAMGPFKAPEIDGFNSSIFQKN